MIRTRRPLVLILVPLWLLLTADGHAREAGTNPDTSLLPRSEVPEEYTWRVADIFASRQDWEQEELLLQERMAQLQELSPDWTASAGKMLAFFQLRDQVEISATKLHAWASLQHDSDLANATFQEMLGEVQGLLSQLQVRLSFVNETILRLGEERFQEYLAREPRLQPYALEVANTLRMAEHVLPRDKQEIVSLTSLFTSTPSEAHGILNDAEIPSPELVLADGSTVHLNTPTYNRLRGTANEQDRLQVIHRFWESRAAFQNTLAVLLDGQVKQHLFTARVHGYSDCLEAQFKPAAVDSSVFSNVIAQTRRNLQPLHRHLALRKRLLGLETYRSEDFYVPAVAEVVRQFTWEETEELMLQMTAPLGEEYGKALQHAFGDRWIDRYPNRDKQSGAYSAAVYGVHPFIKMNFQGTYEDAATLAHELGHALHSSLANRSQPYPLASYHMFVAEVASTFNEHLLVQHMVASSEDDAFRLYLLDSYLQGVETKIYFAALMSELELAMHRRVEEGGSLSAQWLNQTFLELNRTYFGHDLGVSQVGDYTRYVWSLYPHLFLDYYLVNYNTGMITSIAFCDAVLNQGEEGRQRYLQFLKAGGSDQPLAILQASGVDLTSEEPFTAAFRYLDGVVAQMEEIADRL